MRLRIACIAVLSCAAACSTDTTTTSYSVGGQVTGLSGSLTLANNTTDNVTVTGPGAFSFSTLLKTNDPYSVTVVTQPTGETCTVSDGTGTVSNANVTSIKVDCVSTTATKYTVGGSLTGLTANAGTVVLTNGTDQVNVTASGPFVFPTAVPTGTLYEVAAHSAPQGWTCTVTSGSGTVANSNITSVGVACSNGSTGPGTGGGGNNNNVTYSLGGHVTGLNSNPGDIQITNGTDVTSVSDDGNYVVSPALAAGTSYHVAVTHTPAGWGCTVSNPNGTIGNSNVTSADILCSPMIYTISGTVSGQGGAFTLEDQGSNAATINIGANDANFSFPGYNYNNNYDIQVATQPTGKVCSVQNGQGCVGGNVNDIVVTCVNAVSISGAVSGQGGNGFVLALNDSQSISVGANDANYTIPSLPDGSNYKVSIAQHPTGKKCTVASASGTFSGTNVTGADITCVAAHNLSGTLTGETQGLLVKMNDGSNFERDVITTSGTFSLPVSAGSTYAFYILASPVGQSCSITGSGANTGTMSGDVTGLDITCVPATYGIFGTVYFGSSISSVDVSDGTKSSNINGSGNSFNLTPYNDQQSVTLTATANPSGTCTFAQGLNTILFTKATYAGVSINCQ